MRLLQVVPRLAPPVEGVGSFAETLAADLAARFKIETRFVVGDPSWPGGREDAGRVAARTAGALLAALDSAPQDGDAVLLHYAGYGYQPRGCPSWLLDGLRQWKSATAGRLVVLFHEVYATGLPWRSSFWLSPAQRRIAAELARLADGLVTSMRLYRRRLLRWVPGTEVAVLPVFSTVGEPAAVPLLRDRARRLVVFGGSGTRERAYRRLRRQIEAACGALGVEEIWDVGPPLDQPPLPMSRPLRRLGPLPAAEVGALLLESLAGFVGYPAPFLPKSTIFAAYCAHGALPVCAWPWPRRRVEPPPPFWRPDGAGAAVPTEALQAVADRARAWYSDHTLARHAACHRDLVLT